LCHLQHKLIGFYNRDKKCLQRGTDWVFKPVHSNRRGCQVSRLLAGFVLNLSREGDYYLYQIR
jgi:hypothetical protein